RTLTVAGPPFVLIRTPAAGSAKSKVAVDDGEPNPAGVKLAHDPPFRTVPPDAASVAGGEPRLTPAGAAGRPTPCAGGNSAPTAGRTDPRREGRSHRASAGVPKAFSAE